MITVTHYTVFEKQLDNRGKLRQVRVLGKVCTNIILSTLNDLDMIRANVNKGYLDMVTPGHSVTTCFHYFES